MAFAGHEVAALVEHVIVWKPALVIDVQDAAVAAQCGGVVQVIVDAVYEAHERRVQTACGHLLERVEVVLDEMVLAEQVFRGVAGESELRKQCEPGAFRLGPANGLEDATHVPADIADRHVDLRERDTHAVSASSTPSRLETARSVAPSDSRT